LDNRFRGRADVERATGAPVLAAVPRFETSQSAGGSPLISISQPKALASEAYRILRTNLQFIAMERGVKSLVVASASPGEGKTVTAANLASVLAQAGNRVIIVSADLRRPTIENVFGIHGAPRGLSTWLASHDESIWPLLRDPGIPNIRVLPSGPIPQNPAELLNSSKTAELIAALTRECDFLIVDSPPVLAVADATILASRVDATLLVVDASRTHRSATVHAKEELERANGYLAGSVMNSMDSNESTYYYGPRHYYASEESVGSTPGANGSQGSEPDRGKRSRVSFLR
jgi:capsular exopolysaccharide synthesis family protein